MTATTEENICSSFKYENRIWKGPKVVPRENYYKYGEKLLECMRKHSELVGQLDAVTGKHDTFGEMADRSIRCALWLRKQNIRKGDIIGISCGSNMNAIITVIGSLLNGSIFNPWWEITDEDDLIRYFMELTEAKVIFATEKSAKNITRIFQGTQIEPRSVVFGKLEGYQSFDDILAEQTAEEVANFKPEEINSPEHPAFLMYTSGSTGRPKGVLLSYRSLGMLQPFIPRKLIGKSTGFNISTIAWVSGIINPLGAIETGSKMIIAEGVTESEAFAFIEKYQVNWITMGTGIANRMSKNPIFANKEFPSVKSICFSGAVMKRKVYEFLENTFSNACIFSCYGATEVGTVTLTEEKHHPESIGRPIKNAEIKVVSLDDNTKLLGPNEQGEFYIRLSSTMIGYYKNPEATSEAIDADGWYHSGDLGYYNEDGEFFITDRLKELIKYRYFHVPPASIEGVIQGHPGVLEVAVVAKPNNDDVEQPMAFIVKIHGAKMTEQEIIDFIDKNMPDRFKLRGGVQFLDTLPRTASGKVAKNVLRQMAKKIAEGKQNNYSNSQN